MKKTVLILLLVVFVFSSTSCYPGANNPEEIELMFNSFSHLDDYVLLTHFQLVVKGEYYNRSEIKYNEKETNIIFLDENGFYSYTFSKSDLFVEFLYTTYDDFVVTKLGEATLPAKIINSYYGDDCFWFRIDDPSTDEFKQIHYRWNTLDKTGSIVENVDDNYEYSPNNNRTNDYTFNYQSKIFDKVLEIVDNDTGIKKTIDKSILKSFEEGRKISESNSSTIFSPEQIYVIDDDIYFVLGFGVGVLSEPHYYYIVKWNFNTEECTFITSTCFDYFQEWVDDMIIINQ
ncbi:MAG: hypothetical protein IJ400_02695 [Clostridia bacterium]|nr:hypothetical protein [Clostridia bacterium]